MMHIDLSLPALVFIAGTRAALGVGIGMLASQRLPRARRRRVGMGLVAFGALATVPAALAVARGRATARKRL
ncbi:MAG TPA: hypothetical protein VFG69_12030 [Nannocystaceae bacterium]|nr:hypothetical protein [Nannocystaceae bacterium]